MKTIPVIIGGGLAGLSLAISLAPRPVVVIGRSQAQDLTSSELAQGGMAAAMGGDDSPRLHSEDTLVAGAGHCNDAVVRMITKAAPQVIHLLQRWGVGFDADELGTLDLGLEAAHSRRRIVHAGGDSTGARVMEALVARARATASITYLEGEVLALHTSESGAIAGLTYRDAATDELVRMVTGQIVLATGSAAALWRYTTVPSLSWGSGLLLAHEVGARLADIEFVQFHPTALDVGFDPMPLVSEAVRGEGGILVNENGLRFVNPLAPRDIVARAVWTQQQDGHKTFIDARGITDFAVHFPTVYSFCQRAGLDPAHDLIPVRPVAHYHMGGIATDQAGRSSVPGLWAIGECGCTGLHGGNRLASNSLLEAMVMGQNCAVALSPHIVPEGEIVRAPAGPVLRTSWQGQGDAQVRDIMMRCVGAYRSGQLLEEAIAELMRLAPGSSKARLALLIARAALARTKSCGAHERVDADDAQASVDKQETILAQLSLAS